VVGSVIGGGCLLAAGRLEVGSGSGRCFGGRHR
jgi:hypothetical protein